MKRLIILLLMMNNSHTAAQTMKLQELRSLYYESSTKPAAADKLYAALQNAGTDAPILLGYKAMAEFMKCYHSLNPVNKLSFFYKGRADLDTAIRTAPENSELRYLRFTVQTSAPAFLNYRKNISEDQVLIRNQMVAHKNDAELASLIRNYMIDCKECSEEDKAFYKTLDK